MPRTTEALPRITKPCPLCRAELHLWQDSTGSGWMHATAAAEHKCWSEHRDEYERRAAL